MAFDTVVSIGGQSLVDGVWRLLGPALQGLTNPLPIVIPGFANSQMRVTQLVPVFPGAAPPPGGLLLAAMVELSGEALLQVNAAANTIRVPLGSGTLEATARLAGTIDLPERNGTLTLPTGDGGLHLPETTAPVTGTIGAGTIDLPEQNGTLTLPTGEGGLKLAETSAPLTGALENIAIRVPRTLSIRAIPFPAIVPVAVDLTPTGPLPIAVTLTLSVINPSASTRFGLLFRIDRVEAQMPVLPPRLGDMLTVALEEAVDRIAHPLGLPETLRPTVAPGTVDQLLLPVPRLIRDSLQDALTGLLAETGRLVFPPAGTGASCDVEALPTAATAQLTPSTDGAYLLQIGFERPSSTDITAFPPFVPSSAADCNVTIGNAFLLKLLCCLVEKLPVFSLPVAATTGTMDPAGGGHLMCCNYTSATVMLGGMAIGGGPGDFISVCIDPAPAGSAAKTVNIVGVLSQHVSIQLLEPLERLNPARIATVGVFFTIPVAVDLDDLTSLANLREARPPMVSAVVTPNTELITLMVGLAVTVLISINPVLFWPWGLGLALAVGALATALVLIVRGAIEFLLLNAARTLASAAALLRSPAAIPPGLFEAFGRFSPVSVTIDDLTADGVLHTPTAPWGLLPRIGRRQQPPVWNRDPQSRRRQQGEAQEPE